MKTRRSRGLVLCPVVLGLLAVGASAQEEAPTDPPVAGPTLSNSRPVLSKTFDRAMVEDLLANVDAPRNASILKVGYFLRRGGGADALPVLEGFALLNAAAEKEPVGTRRWFLLQSLRGFAAFRTPGVAPSQGYEAYNVIFEYAAEAEHGNAVYPLRQAIAEYVGIVAGKFNGMGLTFGERTEKTLVAAWNANLLALAMPLPGKSRAPEPPWREAIQEAEVEKTFLPLVEKMVADPAAPKNFTLLSAAASVEAKEHPEKALDLLKKAQPLVPRVQGKLDGNEADHLYGTWVDLLEAQKKLDDAVAVQQERIDVLGDGQAKLLLLYREQGDVAQVEKMLASLEKASSNEREVLLAATGLFALANEQEKPDTKAGEQGARVLRNYLNSNRSREVEGELQARLLLGRFFMKQNKAEDAKGILTVPQNLNVPSPRAQGLLRTIEKLRQQLP